MKTGVNQTAQWLKDKSGRMYSFLFVYCLLETPKNKGRQYVNYKIPKFLV